jgi:hypothetical protein
MPEHQPEDQPHDGAPDRSRALDPRTGRDAARTRMQHQNQWVELQLRVAMERGEFDNLPGAGKPIEDLGTEHDPDWWLKKLIERERITGVLPEALQLRKDDLELAELLDRQPNETHVRRELESFNARVVRARMQLQGGPPVITKTRDVEAEVGAWRQRRRTRRQR